jgi:hypothetical protein
VLCPTTIFKSFYDQKGFQFFQFSDKIVFWALLIEVSHTIPLSGRQVLKVISDLCLYTIPNASHTIPCLVQSHINIIDDTQIERNMKNIIAPAEQQSIDLQVQLSMPTDPISKQVNTK